MGKDSASCSLKGGRRCCQKTRSSSELLLLQAACVLLSKFICACRNRTPTCDEVSGCHLNQKIAASPPCGTYPLLLQLRYLLPDLNRSDNFFRKLSGAKSHCIQHLTCSQASEQQKINRSCLEGNTSRLL